MSLRIHRYQYSLVPLLLVNGVETMLLLIYQKYLKKKFFNKILLTYAFITVLTLLSLTFIITSNIGSILQEKEISLNTRILRSVSGYFKQKKANSLAIFKNMYLEKTFSPDTPATPANLLKFIENPESLEYYDSLATRNKLENYFIQSFLQDIDLQTVLVERNLDQTFYITERNRPFMHEMNSREIKLPTYNMTEAAGFAILPSHSITYSIYNKKVYTFAASLSDINLTHKIGTLFLDYNTDSIQKAYTEYKNELKGYILILSQDGEVIFDSSNRFYGAKYPDFNLLLTAGKRTNLNGEICIVNLDTSESPDFIVAGIIPEKEVFSSINSIKQTIYMVSLFCILASVLLTFIGTSRFSRRVKIITDAMKRLRKGDLSYRIHEKNDGDEISEIATSFNQTCDDLKEYINKVYISDIKQKNAMITALQSQINPHFLYNTLEAIRMKAVAEGNEEVGEMIWILSTLFRNSIKEDTIIRIRDEIKYSKLYLELFKIRYEGKLSVNMEVAETLLDYGIIKHIIQPVIENYIIHGFDSRREDNRVSIRCYNEDTVIFIEVSDNGKGIRSEDLLAIRKDLQNFDINQKSSIGLRNVNERIKLIYGNEFGMNIVSEEGTGTGVTLRIPTTTKEELSEYVQSIDRR
jgi:two-component system, sensor histidine kinase YesM